MTGILNKVGLANQVPIPVLWKEKPQLRKRVNKGYKNLKIYKIRASGDWKIF